MSNLGLALASIALCAVALTPSTSDAKRVAPHHIPPPIVSEVRSPYGITLVDGNGEALDTYTRGKRFYVHGLPGQRYSIRVNNPTNRRVEAVVSVDGLDVIDGETADFRNKRGYIIPAYGNVIIDGFRVSTQSVAAFRFSSVSNSYAGRKGKARHVGVIGVAIFKEQARPVLVQPQRRLQRWDIESRSGGGSGSRAPMPEVDSAEPEARPPSRHRSKSAKKERSGLGTAFGEHRSSAVQFTTFRRTSNKPSSIAELRYNDRQGLMALGIRLRDVVLQQDELVIRESAQPFPHSAFARPPR